MIKTAKEAYEIAKEIKNYKKYDVAYCREDDISYFFTYQIPGLPVLRIYKENQKWEEICFNQKYECIHEREVPLSELK
ncbi:MAG: hypothetical protein K2H29_07230 [Oscillospiraceae bacterium]|nr:hypothetical protein [Oscillospiraceae bacterium]